MDLRCSLNTPEEHTFFLPNFIKKKFEQQKFPFEIEFQKYSKTKSYNF